MAETDVDRTVETDVMATVRTLFSVEIFVLIKLFTEVNDELAALREVENEFNETKRFTVSADIAVLNEVSAAAREVDALLSPLSTAEIDAERVPVSVASVVARGPVIDVNPDFTFTKETDTDEMAEPQSLTSVDNMAEMLPSATTKEDTATLNADFTEGIALVRLIASVDTALDMLVMLAMMLAIWFKLVLVVN
uniref:Uncharacterized protein n=1 Tax=viral metagenome TaxID=1070528 RepID=A0A6C0I4E0_9ZZZZ